MRRSMLLPAVILVTAALAAGCADASKPGWTFPPAGAATSVPATSAAPVPTSSGAVGVAGAVAVEAFDLGFKPTATTVSAAGRYTVTLKNTGRSSTT